MTTVGATSTVRRVLLVDDDPDGREAFARGMKLFGGWAVTQAESGAEALASFARQPVDVVLLDMMMPDMDGLETLARLRELDVRVPVVMLTAAAMAADSPAFADLRIEGIISKPIDPFALPGRVLELLGIVGSHSDAPFDPLADARARYVARLPLAVDALSAAVAQLRGDGAPDGAWRDARSRAHKLKGSAGTYGLVALSAANGLLERALAQALREAEPGRTASMTPEIEALLDVVRGMASDASDAGR